LQAFVTRVAAEPFEFSVIEKDALIRIALDLVLTLSVVFAPDAAAVEISLHMVQGSIKTRGYRPLCTRRDCNIQRLCERLVFASLIYVLVGAGTPGPRSS